MADKQNPDVLEFGKTVAGKETNDEDATQAGAGGEGKEPDEGNGGSVVPNNAGGDGGAEADAFEFDPEKHQVPVRQSVFVENRQLKRENKKLQTQAAGEGEGGDGGEGEGGEAQPAPDINNIVQEAVQSALKPFYGVLQQQTTRGEVADHVRNNPTHAKFAPLVEKYMRTPGWEGVPASFIFNNLAGKTDVKVQVKAEADAAAEAKRKTAGGTGGGGRKPDTSNTDLDVNDISNLQLDSEQFNKLTEAVKQGKVKTS